MSDINNTTFRHYLSQHKLMGVSCRSCGKLYLPPRAMCPSCYGEEMDWTELSGRGQLAAYTTVNIGGSAMIAAGYDRDNPYCSGVVRLDDGPAISAQILGVDATHPEQIIIGTRLKAIFLERGEGEERQTFLAFEVD